MKKIAAVAMALTLAGCGGGSADETVGAELVEASGADDTSHTPASEITAATASTTTTTAAPTTSAAPVNSSVDTSPIQPAATAPTTAPTTTASPTTSSTTAPQTATTVSPATTEPLTSTPTSSSFATPSGNISCVIDESGTSCWIGEKSWDIEAPDGCDLDYGNGIWLTANGASYGCYSDVFWDLAAPTLSYGTAVEVGEFTCEIEETGVTCTNGSAQGFTLARAAVSTF